MTDRRLMLLDTAALYFRAFHGMPDTVQAPDGTPINAVRGLLDIIGRLVGEFAPTDLAACWDDAWRPRWRVELVPSYKAHRVEQAGDATHPDVEVVPEALTTQIPIVREVLEALGIAAIGAPDHEADDVIGTLAATASMPVDVVTSDRDLFQVVDDARHVRVISTARGMSNLEVVTDEVLRAKYGVSAAQYPDFATLRGDTSDGLPGVAGIGEKTAASLLSRFDDLDGVFQAARTMGSGLSAGQAAKLRDGEEYARRALPAVRVVRDLDLPDVDTTIRLTDERRATAVALKERYGLGGSMDRALAALGA
ncbi:5'-3' exonuclease [Amnibacterium kyonggiense]|uniref:5'-3' exonuclease n=1 Tax=Amnibacterium kyonggiense TaxID=595671 RepID=A0A4R7FJ19_9MICO|nr:5'-3' exonuclease [Amnibacterium kyonggiense]TDS75832.1 5'-3' exonuclease [Amnibacterium kyonggiense]